MHVLIGRISSCLMARARQSIRSTRFRARLEIEGDVVRRRFEGSDGSIHPGIEQLVQGDPEAWGMPLRHFLKDIASRPRFLSSPGERLLEFLRRYDTKGVNVRVSVDANVPGTLILTIYAYEGPANTVVWLTIGSVSTNEAG